MLVVTYDRYPSGKVTLDANFIKRTTGRQDRKDFTEYVELEMLGGEVYWLAGTVDAWTTFLNVERAKLN